MPAKAGVAGGKEYAERVKVLQQMKGAGQEVGIGLEERGEWSRTGGGGGGRTG